MSTNRRWTSQDMAKQTGRIAIVTGANSGIGFETAKALVLAGATVVLAVRNATLGEQAADRIRTEMAEAQVEVSVLDLASLSSVRSFAAAYRGDRDRLDLLINNAGVMMPPKSTTADGLELQFGTNHIGHFALTGLLLDRLLATDRSRVVTVASAAHRLGHIDFDDLQWERRRYKKAASYGQSKLANLLFTYELQRRLAATGRSTLAVAAHPGWTGTNLQRTVSFFQAMNPFFSMKPWQGALPTLYAATAEDVRGGEYFGPHGLAELRGYPKRVPSNRESNDVAVAERLWQISEELSGVRFDGLG